MSPELALVDPLLARREQAALPDPEDTLRSLAMPWPGRPGPPTDAPSVLSLDQVARWFRLRWRLAAALAIVGLSFVVGSRIVRSDLPTAVAPVSSPVVPSIPAPQQDQPPVAAAPQPRAQRTFAWAPHSGATRYRFELFRGQRLVFNAETPGPSVVVPARWKRDGVQQSLRPGAYRWYVWPLVSGRRLATAIVQATLEVPST